MGSVRDARVIHSANTMDLRPLSLPTKDNSLPEKEIRGWREMPRDRLTYLPNLGKRPAIRSGRDPEPGMVTDAWPVGHDSNAGLEVRIKDGLCWLSSAGGIY